MFAKRRLIVQEDFDLGTGTVTIPTDSGGTRVGTQINPAIFEVIEANVKAYGAAGDGSTDDTAAIQAAAASGATSIYFPGSSGNYLTQEIDWPSTVRCVRGDSHTASVVEAVGSIPTALFTFADTSGVVIKDLGMIVSANDYPASTVLLIGRVNGLQVWNIATEGGGGGIHLSDCLNALVFGSSSLDTVQFGLLADGALSNNVIFQRCTHAGGCTQHGIQIAAGENMHILDCYSEGAFGFALSAYNVVAPSIQRNRTKNTSVEGCNVESCPHFKVIGNYFEWDGSQSTDFGMSIYGNANHCNWGQVLANTVYRSGKAGIAIDGGGDDVKYVVVADNTIINPGIISTGASDVTSGIVIYGPGASNNHIHHNVIYDTNGNMVNGVAEWSNVGVPNLSRIESNSITGNSGADVLLLGALSTTDVPLSFTPTITTTAGPITTKTAEATYSVIGNKCFFKISIAITANGAGAGAVQSDLPYPASVDGSGFGAMFAGRENTAGKTLAGLITSTALTIFNYDNTYPGADSYNLFLSGWYEVDGL